MRKLILILTLSMFVVSFAYAGSEKAPERGKNSQTVYRAGSQKSFKGSEDLFTGAYVTFQPGARTAWHLHPAGQHMIVTSGVGLTGTRDGRIVTIKAGDTIWCPPDIDHWHGATPDSPMTHLVITGLLDGKNVIWKEKVTDEQYLGK